MPTAIDPQYRYKCTWKGRNDSLVRIQQDLVIPKQNIRLESSIVRSLLRRFFEPLEISRDHVAKSGSVLRRSRRGRKASVGDTGALINSLSPESRKVLGDFNTISDYIRFSFLLRVVAEYSVRAA